MGAARPRGGREGAHPLHQVSRGVELEARVSRGRHFQTKGSNFTDFPSRVTEKLLSMTSLLAKNILSQRYFITSYVYRWLHYYLSISFFRMGEYIILLSRKEVINI